MVLVAGIGLTVFVEQGRRELGEEKRLARAAGIPTTVDEFVAALPTVAPEDNAAPLLAKIGQRHIDRRNDDLPDSSKLTTKARANQATQAEIRAYLRHFEDDLRLLEQAADKPSSRFDRDWSQGMAVLFPEYAGIKSGCRVLSLRAWLAFSEGRDDAALADLARIRRIAAHVRREPVLIGHLVALSVDLMAIQVAADALYAGPDRPEVRAFIEAALAEPAPNWATILGTDVLFTDMTYTLMEQPEGWREMGLSEPPRWFETSPFTAPIRTRGRAAVWRSGRREVEALSASTGPEWEAKQTLALEAGYPAFLAGPTTFQVIQMLSVESEDPRIPSIKAAVRYRAFLAALTSRRNAEVVAPEWKEIRAKATWQGKRLTITTTVPGEDPSTVKFPGDPPKP